MSNSLVRSSISGGLTRGWTGLDWTRRYATARQQTGMAAEGENLTTSLRDFSFTYVSPHATEEECGEAMELAQAVPGQMIPFLQKEVTDRKAQAVLLMVCCALTVVSNAFFWLLVLRCNKLHKSFYFLLLNLSASDILMGAFNMPLTAITMWTGRWNFGCTMCRLSGLSFLFGTDATALCLCALSVNRYVRLYWDYMYPTIYGTNCILIHVTATWFFAGLFTLHRVMQKDQIHYQPFYYQCTVTGAKDAKQFRVFLNIVPNSLTWLLVIGLCVAMIRRYTLLLKKGSQNCTSSVMKELQLQLPNFKKVKQRYLIRRWVIPRNQEFMSLPPIPEVTDSKEASRFSDSIEGTVSPLSSTFSEKLQSPPPIKEEHSVDYDQEETILSPAGITLKITRVDDTESVVDVMVQDNTNNNAPSYLTPRSPTNAPVRRAILLRSGLQPWKSSTESRSAPGKHKLAKQKAAVSNVITSLVVASLGFFLVFIPATLLYVLENVGELCVETPNLYTAVLLVIYFCCSCHPLLYAILNPKLRLKYLEQLKCRSVDWKTSLDHRMSL